MELLREIGVKMDLQNSINEVQRKIGRNLLLIQKIEYLLKYIVLHSNTSGKASQLKDIKKTREEQISKMSMGQVLSQYFNHINPSIENNQSISNSESEIQISTEINFNFSKEEYERKENLLSDILKERNDLVHHFILDFDEKSIDSCKNMEYKLEQQKNRLLPQLKELHNMVQAIQKGFNRLKELNELGKPQRITYIHTIAIKKHILFLELAKISIQNHKSGGWISLGFAGKHIRNIMPEEVDKLKDKYGYKTLKPIIQNTEIFVIKEDTTKNMILYKLNDEWKEDFKNFFVENNVESKNYWQSIKY